MELIARPWSEQKKEFVDENCKSSYPLLCFGCVSASSCASFFFSPFPVVVVVNETETPVVLPDIFVDV